MRLTIFAIAAALEEHQAHSMHVMVDHQANVAHVGRDQPEVHEHNHVSQEDAGDHSEAPRPLAAAQVKQVPCEAGETGVEPADGSYLHCRPWTCPAGHRVHGLHMRQRREVHALSDEEWQRYADAINKFYQRPAPQYLANSTTLWGINGEPGATAYVHLHQTTHHGHMHFNFLPFHRRLVLEVETHLQHLSGSCELTIPYWNWAAEKHQFGKSEVWSEDRFGHLKAGCVDNGVANGWKYEKCLNRGDTQLWTPHLYGKVLPDWKSLQKKLKQQKMYEDVRPTFEYWHNSMHCAVHGDMCTLKAPRDPIFYVHHAFIDRAWAMWQDMHPGDEARGCAGCTGLEAFGGVDPKEYVGWTDPDLGCIKMPVSDPQTCLSFEAEPQSVLDLQKEGERQTAEARQQRIAAQHGIRSSRTDDDPTDPSHFCFCTR